MKYVIVDHKNFQGMGEWFETNLKVLDTEEDEEAIKALANYRDDMVQIYMDYAEGCRKEGESINIIVKPIPQHEVGFSYHIECLDIWSNITLAMLDA